MAKEPQPPQRDSLHRVVDKLLRQLPGADPTLKGEGEARPGSTPPSVTTTGPRFRAAPVMGGKVGAASRGPTTRQVAGLWGAVLLGSVVSFAMLAWPYANACGFSLIAYLAAVLAIMLLGGWTAVTAWRYRVGSAHIVALIIAFWAIVLAAEQVLPRIGYAEVSATWWCGN